MTRLRTVLALALCTPLLAVGTASAGACAPLMTDPAGDTAVEGLVPVPEASFDLLSLDAASTTKALTLVVRTAADMRDETSQVGRATLVSFALGGPRWTVQITDGAVQPEGSHLSNDVPGEGTTPVTSTYPTVPVAPVYSADGRQVSVVVPYSAFAKLGTRVRAGQTLADPALSVEATFGGATGVGPVLDTASSRRLYALGSRSCTRLP